MTLLRADGRLQMRKVQPEGYSNTLGVWLGFAIEMSSVGLGCCCVVVVVVVVVDLRAQLVAGQTELLCYAMTTFKNTVSACKHSRRNTMNFTQLNRQ